MTFQEMKLIPGIMSAIQKSEYVTPTPIQEATIPLVLDGKDILGCAQTGTGKTAAFVLPMLQRLACERPVFRNSAARCIRALVLAPTRELAIQNYDAFIRFGKGLNIRTITVFGGVSQNTQIGALKMGVDVLVATPGRLIDLINQGYVQLADLEVFVLDEADRMLDMGFIHDVKRIIALLPKKRQTLLFSATMPPEVENLALGLLTDPETVKVDPVTSTVDKIEQSVYFVSKDDKKQLLVKLMKDKSIGSALVFTRTKSGADQVVRLLERSGVAAMAIHGNKSQSARQTALNSFKEGKIRVLAATDIAARGIDTVELPFVINYNIPEVPETYIHRIGRTGRAGLGGNAISMCCSEELLDWRAIEKLTGNHVPTAECEWSISDMKPTPKPKKEPYIRPEKAAAQQSGRGERRSRDFKSQAAPARGREQGGRPRKRGGRSK